jgi:Ser/Thr protein kinase RdoA (MazF antagonist)
MSVRSVYGVNTSSMTRGGDVRDREPDPSAKVLRRWEIDEVRELVRLPGGTHDRWRVSGAAAPLLLKRYRAIDRGRVLFEHSVAALLDAARLPVPAPVPARSGRTLIKADQHYYALYPWTDGVRRAGLELSLGQCHELGALLGELHAALDRLLPPVQQCLLVPTTRAAAALAEADRLLAALPAGGDDFTALAERRLRERRALLAEYADHQPPEVEAFAVGHVHGAFHAPHLLYGRTRRVTAVVGWGGLRVGPIAADVVGAAAALFAHDDDQGLDLGRAEAFCRGHASMFPLDAGQVGSAVHRVWWERLCATEPLRRHYLDRDSAAPGAAALVAWWTANLDRTLDVFAAPYLPGAADERDFGES